MLTDWRPDAVISTCLTAFAYGQYRILRAELRTRRGSKLTTTVEVRSNQSRRPIVISMGQQTITIPIDPNA